MKDTQPICLLLMSIAANAPAAENMTYNGCVIRPGTLCTDLNLRGLSLRGADLFNSQFSGSNLAQAPSASRA